MQSRDRTTTLSYPNYFVNPKILNYSNFPPILAQNKLKNNL